MRRSLLALAATALLCTAVPGPAFAATVTPTATPSPSSPVDNGTLIQPDSDSALLNLLGQQGVDYFPVRTLDAALGYQGAETTLVISDDKPLTADELARLTLGRFGRIIILNNDAATLKALLPGVTLSTSTGTPASPVQPSCNQQDAAAAGAVDFHDNSASFILPAGTTNLVGCYPVNGKPTLVYKSDLAYDVFALGSSTFIDNNVLSSQGNAALALRLFGAYPNLVWLAASFIPDVTLNNCGGTTCEGGGGSGPTPGSTTTITAGSGNGHGNGNGGGGSSASGPTLTSLMPTWIWWALLQLLIAVLLTAYWRGRRLGAVVTERLPVTVRAAETVEGHARLYRRANAHGRAAELLRKAAASRLAGLFGIPAARAHADPSLLVAPVAARLQVAEDLIADLLAGQAPQSEAELVLLADHLDQLEQEVRSS
jgi:hypothetical protein